ncbi:hypothetical protein [Nitrospirillum viridazoti]|uniref:Uncharacterized protein n=1 Tax=Nitrospirillum amazonense TaxID=28077 RepID=A0A560IZ31_9PROT|nr:hypothetical protein [Nitrospirillum amazonense]TWB62234.1 hypothetical protein FBZ92_105169 [Nitrospirillum amazonense]
MAEVIPFRARPRPPGVRLLPPIPTIASALHGLLQDIHADAAEFHAQPAAAAALASSANRLRIVIANMADPGGAA